MTVYRWRHEVDAARLKFRNKSSQLVAALLHDKCFDIVNNVIESFTATVLKASSLRDEKEAPL